MGLQQKIQSELKGAMKAKDTAKTSAIRVLIGEFQRQPEKELSDDQVIGIIKKMIKSERELMAASGDMESEFLQVLQVYLPQQASEEDIRRYISENLDLSSFKNKMQAMKPVMAHFGSRADGNLVKSILQDLD